jgi:hypothetical protein
LRLATTALEAAGEPRPRNLPQEEAVVLAKNNILTSADYQLPHGWTIIIDDYRSSPTLIAVGAPSRRARGWT